MRKWLAALILATGLAHGADIRYSVTVPGTKDVIVLYPGYACSPKVTALVEKSGATKDVVAELQGGTSVFDGKRYATCFLEVGDLIAVIYEDGETGLIPKELFTLESKI